MDWIWAHPGLSCAALLAWAAFAALRLPGRGGEAARSPLAGVGRWRALASEEGGTAAAEFALAAPVLLALVLFAVQLALVAVSRRAVEGAAFAAARSASVWVPADSDEGPNRLRLDGDSPKRERIVRAAALALLPVAPAEAVDAGRPGADVAGPLRELARETGLASPDELVRRYAAARARLRVDVRGFGETGTGGLLVAGPDDPLTVTVSYACPLHVPIAARLLGVRDRRVGGFTAELSAQCTVRNEGTPERPLILGE
jgi:hypothetical protein